MAKLRVYELAQELGVESKYLLKRLKDAGEFVRSASSTLEPPVVSKIRQELAVSTPPRRDTRPVGNNPVSAPRRQERSWQRRGTTPSIPAPARRGRRTTFQPNAGQNPNLDEAARIFDIDPSDLKPARQRSRSGKQVDPWLLVWIDPAEKREWLAAGLSENDLPLVLQCKQIGMNPEDLRVALPHGDTPVRRLWQGEAVAIVKDRIEQARQETG